MMEKNAEMLRGQPFIGRVVRFDNPEDIAYGSQVDRICNLCFYRVYSVTRDCDIDPREGKTPKELFGFRQNEYLPTQLDGKEIGYYCPYFTDYRTDDMYPYGD